MAWILAEEDGKIITCHCNCMAGIGESCSHVASVLWALESGVRIRDSMTVTQKKAYWVIPGAIKSVPYAPISSIKFIGKKGSINAITSRPSKSPTPVSDKPIPSPSHEEMQAFFGSLASISSKPAILSLIDPYSDNYVPKSLDENLPMVLTSLYKQEYTELNYGDLLKKSCELTISVSQDEAALVESKTRGQAQSRLWFRMRTGRITASRFKSACHTDPSCPSLSLIMSICHPETTTFKSAATSWGCAHEKEARLKYEQITSLSHTNFEVLECGLFINCEFPFVGASPDGLVSCSCCGDGICEIKVGNPAIHA